MLAESLRHHLGDLTNENTEVFVEVHGSLYAVARFLERPAEGPGDRTRFVLVAHNYPTAGVAAAQAPGQEKPG